MTRNRINYCLFCLLALLVHTDCSAKSPELSIDDQPPKAEPYHDVAPAVNPNVKYYLPVDTRIALSGNYGELRPNHFHGGLDFKTDQSTGHPVYAFSDGFVRRAAINAYGYGLVLYVEHPALGLTSVYGHLEGFNDQIWQKVRERQVRDELNNADVTFGPDELPVRGGDVIAKSGNTGSSGGPHVHFELRNIPTDDNDIYYDPQMYFLRELTDTQAPRISHVYLYPQAGEGVANGQATRQVSSVTGICATQGGQGGKLSQPFTAWGRIGIGLKAYDYMNGQANKYGIKEIRLLLEEPAVEGGETLYQFLWHFRQDVFRYSEQRYTNSVTDYAAWVGQKSMIMKSFIEPGNMLQQVDHQLGNGIVDINEERLYHFIYELTDAHGNLSSLDFYVRGVRDDLSAAKVVHSEAYQVSADQPLQIDSAGCHLWADAGVFYDQADFRFRVAEKATATRTVLKKIKNKKGKLVNVKQQESYDLPVESKVYTLGTSTLPMHTWVKLSIDVPADIEHPEQLYISPIDGGGTIRRSRFETTDGGRRACVSGQMREGGRYAVRRDGNGPSVSVTKAASRHMQVSVADEESGVKQFRVSIDGKFVPFDMDNTGRYFGDPILYGVKAGQDHIVEIVATDYCGNETRYSKQIRF